MAICAITTEDNPFNPLTDFDNWYTYDETKGYHTSSILARMANLNSAMSEKDMENEIEDAVDKMIKWNFTGNYKKVTAESS